MLLNYHTFVYNPGDRVIMLGTETADGRSRAVVNSAGGLTRDAMRRATPVLIEGVVSAIQPNDDYISIEHRSYRDDQLDRDYGRPRCDVYVNRRTLQATGIPALTTMRRSGLVTEPQMNFLEQFLFPVPLVSSTYMSLLLDIKTAVGGNTDITCKDRDEFFRETEALGIRTIEYPMSPTVFPATHRLALQQAIEAYNNPPVEQAVDPLGAEEAPVYQRTIHIVGGAG